MTPSWTNSSPSTGRAKTGSPAWRPRNAAAPASTRLKVRYNKVFGYYLEVSRANLHLVPADYIRKQTLVNAERFITADLKEYESRVLGAEETRLKRETALFLDLRRQAAAGGPPPQAGGPGPGDSGCPAPPWPNWRPCIATSRPRMTARAAAPDLKQGRHPVIERPVARR